MALTIIQKLGVLSRNDSAFDIIKAVKKLDSEGIEVPIQELEHHQKMKIKKDGIGDLVDALIFSKKNCPNISFQTLQAIDLCLEAGLDEHSSLVGLVEESLTVRKYLFPDQKGMVVKTKDNLERKIQLNFSHRLNLERYIGGMSQDIMGNRAAELCKDFILKEVSSENFTSSLVHVKNHLLKQDLDAGTKYEIISLEVKEFPNEGHH